MACDPCHSVRRPSSCQFTDTKSNTMAHDDTISFHGTLDHRASEPIDMLQNKFQRTNAGTVTAATYSSYQRHCTSPMAYSHLPHHPPMPTYEGMNTPLMQAETGHSSSSAPPFQHYDNRSLSISPPVDFDGYTHDYHSDAIRFQGVDNECFGATEMYPGLPLYNWVGSGATLTPPPSNFSVPLSPQSSADWTSLAHLEGRPRSPPKCMRLNTTVYRRSPVLRSDGVRKKNARFDIPSGRTVDTIDDLIDNAKDDALIKELKTQKRLLRNREAALQSRQKKKVHTERLEEEKKYFTNVISQLEEQVAALTTQTKQHEHQKKEWVYLQAETDQRLQQVHFEKQEMAKTYANESCELQAKITMLQESIRNARSSSMSTVPSSTDYSDFASNMNHIGMDNGEWEGYSLGNDFCFDPATTLRQQEAPALFGDTKQSLRQSTSEVDKSVASNLLLTLLLCGAYAVSIPRNDGSLPVFRHLPNHILTAATLVLHTVFENTTCAPEMQPQFLKPRHKFADFVPDPSYTMSSLKQEDGLMASFESNNGNVPLGHRSDLIAAFATLRQDGKDGLAAETYAFRMMRGDIGSNVVSEFKKMID